MGWLSFIVLLLIIVIGSIIHGINHLEDKRQKTRGGYHPPPPPLLVLYFCNTLLLGVHGGICYYWGICVGYDSSGYLSNILLLVGDIYFFIKFF